MASVSYSLAVGDDYNPDKITVDTQAPNAGAVEVRIDLTKVTTKLQVKMILDAIERRIDAVGTIDLGIV